MGIGEYSGSIQARYIQVPSEDGSPEKTDLWIKQGSLCSELGSEGGMTGALDLIDSPS